MCNMLKRHAFVFTRTKPWTTVDGSIATLIIPELCMMCDVHLIYLRNNKYCAIKCKPEVLSPLPRPIPFKRESSSVQQQLEHSTLSPTQEIVVGILDASQSSCTLVSLPSSPQTNQIEVAKKPPRHLTQTPVHPNQSKTTSARLIRQASQILMAWINPVVQKVK